MGLGFLRDCMHRVIANNPVNHIYVHFHTHAISISHEKAGNDWSMDSLQSNSQLALFCVCVKVDKLFLKSIKKCKGPRIAKTISEKSKVGGSHTSQFKSYHKVILVKTVW